MNQRGSASGAGLECPVLFWASQVTPVVKNLPANAGDARDACLIPGSGRRKWRRKWQPIPWTEENGGLQTMGWQRIGQD